jgi:ankyrin repeat protein
MDIGSLLAEVAAETFTDELLPIGEKKSNETNTNPINKKESQSTLSILQSSAAVVHLEDTIIAEKVLQNVTKDIISGEAYDELAADVDELIKSSSEVPSANEQQKKVTLEYDDPDDETNYDYEKEDAHYSDSRFEKVAEVANEGKFDKVDDEISDEGDEDSEREDIDIELDSKLILACARPNYDSVITALRNGAYISCRDRHGWTPLHWVASKGATDLVELLIEKRKTTGKKLKPFVNAADTITGWTPLHVKSSMIQSSH